ncbi:MAG: TetR family transcriptional regulator [Rhodobiaceae bacterium]|nr:TetR family transcriptional regulator [Rhodobiaceae bacterium]
MTKNQERSAAPREGKGGQPARRKDGMPEGASARQFKRRAEIIDAAAQTFADLGYNASSTQNIAEVLNLRQASLYYYFSTKQDALREVCLIGVQGFVETLEEICASDRDWADKVRAGIRHHLLPLREKRAYVKVFQRDRHHVTGPGRKQVGAVTRHYEGLWQKLIEDGRINRRFDSRLDARTATLAILGMCNAASAWLDPEKPGEIERVAEQFAVIVLCGILADSGPEKRD